MQQIVRAFGRVEGSFQYLVHSWTVIVELISVYKRLRAFEAALYDRGPYRETPAMRPKSIRSVALGVQSNTGVPWAPDSRSAQ